MIFRAKKEPTLNIHSIFESVNGEVCKMGQGSFTHFVRLAGCNLDRCTWCDTPFAHSPNQGHEVTLSELIPSLNVCPLVTITGGEPLLQKAALEDLCRELWYQGYSVSIETNGSICVPKDWHASWVVDYKLPFSGMNAHMIAPANQWSKLHLCDFVKFVVYGEDDLKMAITRMKTVPTKATFAISPVVGIEKAVAVKDIIKEVIGSGVLLKKNVILNHQLHKVLDLREPH
jgi:7-carboxy-7-deazaguanine synthase